MDFIRKNMHYGVFFFVCGKIHHNHFVGSVLTGLMSELQL